MPRQGEHQKYSVTVGVIFLFNLIVGTGALALPGAFQKSGYIIGVILLLILALFSLITVTFIIEALADANALSRKVYQGDDTPEETPLVQEDQENDVFEMTEKYELGQLGVLMTPKWSQVLIYFCLCIYLYGDLAIYETVVGRTSTYIFCTYNNNDSLVDYTTEKAACWEGNSLNRRNFYRISLGVFVCLIGPFVFFNLHKTLALQILTISMRWLAFLIMIAWNMIRLSELGNEGNPPVINLSSTPTLFGTLVYSFMCQHSIPGLLQPIADKKYLPRMINLDYVLVACFYIALSLSSIFAFKNVEDIFTLNFWEITVDSSPFTIQRILSYYLAFFPIFTLSTSFPIIGITLRNNLRNMILRNTPPTWYYDKLLFPLLTIIPPTILSLSVSDLHLLVGIVGSYAGACIQYMIPCLLIQFGRKQVQSIRGTNKYASPFKSLFWIIAVYVWMLISLAFITSNYVLNEL